MRLERVGVVLAAGALAVRAGFGGDLEDACGARRAVSRKSSASASLQVTLRRDMTSWAVANSRSTSPSVRPASGTQEKAGTNLGSV